MSRPDRLVLVVGVRMCDVGSVDAKSRRIMEIEDWRWYWLGGGRRSGSGLLQRSITGQRTSESALPLYDSETKHRLVGRGCEGVVGSVQMPNAAE